MRRLAAALATMCVLLLPAAGETFSFAEYGFTAEFPATPTVSPPQGSEKDENGNFISSSVDVMAAEQGVYAAIVSVESYSVPRALDSTQVVNIQRDNFVKGLKASLGASTSGTQDGFPAVFFSYERPDHSVAGNGLVVYIAADKPRDYIVVTMHTPHASAAQIAALDEFLKSFHIK